jgi:hypothetical protein
MSGVNYKEEVLKVYPDAYQSVDIKQRYVIIDLATSTQLGISNISRTYSWQSAYNKLKQEGKIL